MQATLTPVDKLEILTLQDNYIDLVAMDNSDVVQRANPVKDSEIKNSLLAEHGFSALLTATVGGRGRKLLFDFGFSARGAASNADALDLDLSEVEALVLSHGHMDHFGGMKALVEKIGRTDLELVLHPEAFRRSRFLQHPDGNRAYLPSLTPEYLNAAGVTAVPTREPRLLLDGHMLFLGEVPRTTAFETGSPALQYDQEGQARQDVLEDDSALVVHLKDKGLVILSGCAHSGIVNTVTYARQTTGINRVHVVMGGFHLTGAPMDTVIEPTAEALRAINPAHVIPTHCTGRQAVMHLEREMPDQFLLNMSGTKLTFSA
jgi:7,8-dihydropterin-6-yl-methyl-4-(beta-D-ribofuranosyl)aminobenzene 5'-phosphate synthase